MSKRKHWKDLFSSGFKRKPPEKVSSKYKIFFCEDQAFFLKLEFTPCKAEHPLRGMELQQKEAQKD